MLCQLARRPGQLVTKDEFFQTVWRGLVVEESNLHVQVSLLRKAIGADAVLNVPGAGYRFVLDVREAAEPEPEREPPEAGASGRAAEPTSTSRPPLRRLSVIVLPFVESHAPPEEAYFADAITDDVTTQLSKIHGSYVIGSSTALAHKGEKLDIATVARDLGVRYVLQGRVERTEASVEANVRLSDAATGAVVWSDVIEVPRVGVGHIRHELVARLAAALGLELIAAEAGRSLVGGADNLEAQDLVMQALAASREGASRERYEAAIRLCDHALRLQPDFGPALAVRARFRVAVTAVWPGPDDEARIAQVDSDITRALAQDSLDARSHATLARVRQLQFRLDAAKAALDQALALNPCDPMALGWCGHFLILSGQPDAAPALLHRALTLSPRDPVRWVWFLYLAWAHLLSGEYEQALPWCEKAQALMPRWWPLLHLHAAASAHLDRPDEARAALARAEEVPQGREYALRFRHSQNEEFLSRHRQHWVMGLLKAGLPDALERFEAFAAFQRRCGKP
ncbi:MAG: winged helix-turn-helix domain-containing protein [Rubrivivax sp.]|nr:winged helix-turn-helix domain-containing protein [Rubrivivax sp.]